MIAHIEVSKSALLSNLKQFRNMLPKNVEIAVVLKGNAYGHDQNFVAQIVDKFVDYIQLDDMDELRRLRKVTKKKVLLLGYVESADLEECLRLNAVPSIYDLKRLKVLDFIGNKLGRKAEFHLKIDCLLGRQGILPNELSTFLNEVGNLKNVQLAGAYSHFANIEDTKDPSHALKQKKIFEDSINLIEKAGFTNFKTHMSATSGVLLQSDAGCKFDIVRLGIGLWGLWPSEDLKNKYGKKINLTPALRWVTKIAQVKVLPDAHPIGYGLTYVTKKETKVAVIPQGYSDGYDRRLSNKGEVLIKGTRCKVLGRVAMNMFVVDVSHLDKVEAEEEVVLLGKQGSEEITAEELAKKISTVSYEVITRIGYTLPRIAPNLKRIMK